MTKLADCALDDYLTQALHSLQGAINHIKDQINPLYTSVNSEGQQTYQELATEILQLQERLAALRSRVWHSENKENYNLYPPHIPQPASL
jgi:chromosome segregation ATPase